MRIIPVCYDLSRENSRQRKACGQHRKKQGNPSKHLRFAFLSPAASHAVPNIFRRMLRGNSSAYRVNAHARHGSLKILVHCSRRAFRHLEQPRSSLNLNTGKREDRAGRPKKGRPRREQLATRSVRCRAFPPFPHLFFEKPRKGWGTRPARKVKPSAQEEPT